MRAGLRWGPARAVMFPPRLTYATVGESCYDVNWQTRSPPELTPALDLRGRLDVSAGCHVGRIQQIPQRNENTTGF